MRLDATALLASLLLLTPAATPGQERPENTTPARGRILFRLHCASCHGKTGRGDGPVAEVLKVAPTDLAAIARRRRGKFPLDEIRRIIDGRIEIASHGSREMPVWGLSFRDPGRSESQESAVEGQVELLIEYLRSIQRPPT